ncbi:MAG TPA: hypothetical protein VEZ47_00845 [Gemmatirosa sp.]|nr:hypothetical protein [Gemmatirosa sp.]
MLISRKPPDVVFGTLAIVSTVPACTLREAALPELTMSWPRKIVDALEPLVTVSNVVGEQTAMLAAVSVPPPPVLPMSTSSVRSVSGDDAPASDPPLAKVRLGSIPSQEGARIECSRPSGADGADGLRDTTARDAETHGVPRR